MTPENLSRALKANVTWGDAREELGRARARAELLPSADHDEELAETIDIESRALDELNARLIIVGLGPMPYR